MRGGLRNRLIKEMFFKANLRNGLLALAVFASFFICSNAFADPKGWKIIQLSDDLHTSYNPKVSGSNVVWWVDGTKELMLFEGSTGTITDLSINGYANREPVISGLNVAWSGWNNNGYDWEIYYYNGSTTRQISYSSLRDHDPHISDSNIVWIKGAQVSY